MTSLISVIIPTLNSSETLPRLLHSLAHQSYRDFSIIISDGGSTDDTLNVIRTSNLSSLILLSRPDHGIYDAINHAIQVCSSPYYIVAGSDDYFFDCALEEYSRIIRSSYPDLVSAPIVANYRLIQPGRSWNPIRGPFSCISSHSIGCAIRKDMHDLLSLYREDLKIAADYLFLQQCLDSGAKIAYGSLPVGFYSAGGLSSSSPLLTILDQYQALILSKSKRKLLYFWVPFFRIIYSFLKSACRYNYLAF